MHQSVDYDSYFMQMTLSLAKKGWGKTGINPLVGAVITKNNHIVGTGFHRKIGEAHAEVCALTEAGIRARGATLYVNLEPCCCSGFTPPCVEAIRKAHTRRVVIGCLDPNPLVNGKGAQMLRENDIEVSVGVLPYTTQALNLWYARYITTMTPYVILKIATSRNGKISGFEDTYITSEASRRYVHALRSKVHAVLIGITTVLTDNPYLTDRFIAGRNPARIVIDPHLRLPLDAHFMNPDARRIIITGQNNDVAKLENLIARGAEIVLLEGATYSASAILDKLSSLRIGSVLVEGGGKVVTRFFEEKCYDEFYCFMAPHEVADGVSLSEHIMQEIVAKDRKPQTIGEDTVYHVYRNN